MIMNNIIDLIKKSNGIAITFHISADGDSLGSSLALMQGLRELGKNVYIMAKEEIPKQYKFLPFSNEITIDNCSVKEEVDCVIVLDCGNVERINANLTLKDKTYSLINMDHHMSNDLYGDLNYVDTNASSMGEIVYQLLKLLGISIDSCIAECLYTSIIADTGNFRYSNTTLMTHSIAGDLINSGINFSKIYRVIYEDKEFIKVKLIGRIIQDMYLSINENVCILKVTLDMMRDLNIESIDSADIISIGSEIKESDVTLLLKETENGVKFSLRSKEKVDVRKISEHFGGGGHIRASGGFIRGDMVTAEKMLLSALKKELV